MLRVTHNKSILLPEMKSFKSSENAILARNIKIKFYMRNTDMLFMRKPVKSLQKRYPIFATIITIKIAIAILVLFYI